MAEIDYAALDPYTLRVIARQVDSRADKARKACPCLVHGALAKHDDEFAVELRTVAIRASQAAGRPITTDGDGP